MLKLKPCPNCGKSGRRIRKRPIMSGKARKIIPKMYFECPSCWLCSEPKLFEWRAIREWNKGRAKKEGVE